MDGEQLINRSTYCQAMDEAASIQNVGTDTGKRATRFDSKEPGRMERGRSL